jgi:hypothetical protein
MDLEEAVTQLYGLAPEAFLDARRELAARAKAEKDTGLAKAVASVRKPTAAAWAVNQLVRHRPAEVERLLELADALHRAQDAMDGTALKTLGRQRTSLVDELVRATAEVALEAGSALSPPVANQVRETFVAALASTSAAAAVGSGHLTRALSYAGFGDVDLSEATAAPSPARRPALRVITGEGGAKRPGKKAPVEQDEASDARSDARSDAADGDIEDNEENEDVQGVEAVEEPDLALLDRLRVAEKRSRETMAEAARTGDALGTATEALEELDARIAELDSALKTARAQRADLVQARSDAAAANKVAERTLRAALAEVDQIRAQLPDDED